MASPNNFKEILMEASVDLINEDVQVLLLDNSSSYTFDPVNHIHVADVLDTTNDANAGNEMSGTGYSRKSLGTKSVTQDDTDNEGVFDAADVTWSGLDAGTIQTIVLFEENADGSGDSTNPVYVVLDDDSAGSVADLPLTTNGSDVTIAWDAEGIINIS